MTEKLLRITVVGYGKMGRELANSAETFGAEVVEVVEAHLTEEKVLEKLRASDVAVILTSPDGAFLQVSRALRAGIPIVCGTTGWDRQIPEARLLCQQENGALLIANNFSLGVHIFFALNRYLSKLMQIFPNYKPSISETHHISKQDRPSGTATELAEQILGVRSDLEGWSLAENSPNERAIPVSSLREGRVVGRHIVEYSSGMDSISIRHNAKNRLEFVRGAVLAAKFILDKKGVFSMQDVLAEELSKIAQI